MVLLLLHPGPDHEADQAKDDFGVPLSFFYLKSQDYKSFIVQQFKRQYQDIDLVVNGALHKGTENGLTEYGSPIRIQCGRA